ncbi:hypothetical protein EDC04DRAFT_269738 [Pisolithus marmoratus]|nr:hypothetical protein EDC04DRAFT_269738 [Pisolithus marmoratus]
MRVWRRQLGDLTCQVAVALSEPLSLVKGGATYLSHFRTNPTYHTRIRRANLQSMCPKSMTFRPRNAFLRYNSQFLAQPRVMTSLQNYRHPFLTTIHFVAGDI